MSDLISRQAVMDAAKAVMKDTLDSLPTRLEGGEEVYDVRTSELDFILGINKALQNAIKALPSETHDLRTETHGVCLDELISRQGTIDAIEHVTWYHQNRNGQMVSGANSDEHQAWYKAEDVYEAIEAVPSTNKSGHWMMNQSEVAGEGYYICSNCNNDVYDATSFCPNCGADMRGGDDE